MKTFVFFGVHRVSNEPYDMVNVTHCMIGHADNWLSFRANTKELSIAGTTTKSFHSNHFSRIFRMLEFNCSGFNEVIHP